MQVYVRTNTKYIKAILILMTTGFFMGFLDVAMEIVYVGSTWWEDPVRLLRYLWSKTPGVCLMAYFYIHLKKQRQIHMLFTASVALSVLTAVNNMISFYSTGADSSASGFVVAMLINNISWAIGFLLLINCLCKYRYTILCRFAFVFRCAVDIMSIMAIIETLEFYSKHSLMDTYMFCDTFLRVAGTPISLLTFFVIYFKYFQIDRTKKEGQI